MATVTLQRDATLPPPSCASRARWSCLAVRGPPRRAMADCSCPSGLIRRLTWPACASSSRWFPSPSS
eukprot:9439706-Alexandrium_andersonii.AAC.1